MFKRIIYTLLIIGLVFGVKINNSTTNNTTTTTTKYTPKISKLEFQKAKRAPVYTNCVHPGQVAFTFDDGPDPITTPKILKFLKEKNIIGTFFITAYNDERKDKDVINLISNQDCINMVKRTVKEGHFIGSHTFYHKNLFLGLKDGSMEESIDKMTDKIQNIIGAKPVFFRPPMGNGGYDFDDKDKENAPKNKKIQKYLGASGFKIIMWGADTRDWENKENVDKDIAELNKHMSLEKASPKKDSFIILMHDIYNTTAELALPKVYEYVTGLGYKIVSLPECLGMSSAAAYQGGVEPLKDIIVNEGMVETDVQANLNVDTAEGEIPDETTNESPKDSSDASGSSFKIIYTVYAIILSFVFFF